MATIQNKRGFSGMVGNVVFRNYRGKPIVQSRPSQVKQTTATKISASEFGNVSRWAKQLRSTLTPLLVGLTDGEMHQRFTGALYTAIKNNTTFPKGQRTLLNTNMDSLCGFEFNAHSPFAKYFKPTITASLTASNEVTVAIPAFDPKTEMLFPEGCNAAKLTLYIVATNFKDAAVPLVFHSILALNKNTSVPAQTLVTTTPLPEGYFALASAKLLYFTPNLLTESNYLNTKTLSPAMVVLATATAE